MGGICARMELAMDIKVHYDSSPLPLWEREFAFRSFRGGRRHQRIVDRRRLAVRSFVLVGDSRQLLPRLLGLALPVPHTGIKSAGCQKLAVGSALGDTALVEHDDFVGAHDR